jgi:hypothetical protein
MQGKAAPLAPNHYALLLEYRWSRENHGSYRYGDAAGLLRDRGTFKIRALARNGRTGFTITCWSDLPPDETPRREDG